MIGAIQCLKLLQENCLTFSNISARDNRDKSNFHVILTKILIFEKIFPRSMVTAKILK